MISALMPRRNLPLFQPIPHDSRRTIRSHSRIAIRAEKWAILGYTIVEELSSCHLGGCFRCFGDYLLRKFHTLSALCLKGLGAYVAGCHGHSIRKGYNRFLPFVDRWFKVEDI